MFALRGLAIALSVFVLVYCGLSLAVCGVWRSVWLYLQTGPTRLCADALFALRIFPFVAAAAVTVVFAIPSFLLLEPTAINEPIGVIPLALGSCALILAAIGVTKATLALLRASRTIADWIRHATLIDRNNRVPLVRITRIVPALTAAGILRPRVLISDMAESALTPKELRTALRHELAHIGRRDNLKKLVMCFLAFPGMRGLETAWLGSTEMAADDAAVSCLSEALDLAAALIKLSRVSAVEPPLELTTSFAHRAADLVNTRVARLIAWTEPRREPKGYGVWYAAGAGLTMATMLTVSYSALLIRIHAATEWLVR
jgi:Zn-dependent protease with chaperone function